MSSRICFFFISCSSLFWSLWLPLWSNVLFTHFLLIRDITGRYKAKVNFYVLFISTIRGVSKKDYKTLFLKSLYFSALPMKVVPPGCSTFLKAHLPPLEVLLEFFFCDALQCVPHGSLDVVYRLEIIFTYTYKGKCKGVLCKYLTIPTSPLDCHLCRDPRISTAI